MEERSSSSDDDDKKTSPRFQIQQRRTEVRELWAVLPDDILRVIKRNLCLFDQIRLGAVCKGWRVFGNPIMAMTYCPAPHGPNMKFGCEIYDTYGERVRNATYDMFYQNWYFSNDRGPKVCAAKNGWLLMVDVLHDSGPVTLINPFSNAVLPVPKLGHQIDVATFCGIPTSPNCKIFAFYSSGGETHLGTYCVGDKNWQTFLIAERKEGPEPVSVVYTEGGLLYYVFKDGVLGCCNLTEDYYSLLTESFSKDFSLPNEKHFHLVECGGSGQIVLVLGTVEVNYEWRLFRFDQHQRRWIAQRSLGERTLFASPTSFVVDNEANLTDCICYFDSKSGKAMFYSFKGQRSGQLDYKPQKDFEPELIVNRFIVTC